MTLKLTDDCFVLDKDRLPHHEALEILRARVKQVTATEQVPLAEATGRFLAEPIIAPRPIPAHNNAAVDGYVFASSAYNSEKGTSFRIAGEATAGHPFQGSAPGDGTIRIFTGAVIPPGLDTIAMQEDVRLEERDGVRWACIPPGTQAGCQSKARWRGHESRRDARGDRHTNKASGGG